MKKEVKLFDKRFVHFMWDNELEGKVCFVADNINSLIERVEKGVSIHKVHWSRDNGMPFESDDLLCYRFAYYDENYLIKKVFNEGKKVQYQLVGGVDWGDIDSEEALECRITEGRTFRIKPEEEKWIVYLAMPNGNGCYLTACAEDAWNEVKQIFGAKTKLFVGTKSEVEVWYKARQKFTDVIEAWEDGKTIQFLSCGQWEDCRGKPLWHLDNEYRAKPEEKTVVAKRCRGCIHEHCSATKEPCVSCKPDSCKYEAKEEMKDEKPECPCEDGIDSKACVGCEHSEDGKQTVRPFKDCNELVEFWIKNYQSRMRAANTKPLIWVRLKVDKRERLIVGFGTDFVEIGNKAKVVPLQKLFDNYEFLDGNPCGIKEE